jgi:predicted ATPase
MARFILTGPPGSGKTAVLRLLERDGFAVVEEAATDVIALQQAMGEPRPWDRAGFIEQVTALQRQREGGGPDAEAASFFDRSPVCTLALARFLGRAVPPLLAAELSRLSHEAVYARRRLKEPLRGGIMTGRSRRAHNTMTRVQGTRLSPDDSGASILVAVWSAIVAALIPGQ